MSGKFLRVSRVGLDKLLRAAAKVTVCIPRKGCGQVAAGRYHWLACEVFARPSSGGGAQTDRFQSLQPWPADLANTDLPIHATAAADAKQPRQAQEP